MKRILMILLSIISCGLYSYAQVSATINDIWLEHNVNRSGKTGMIIHTSFDVSGMKGKRVMCIVFFYNAKKEYLKTTYSGYKTTSNDVCAYGYGNVTYEDSQWKDFKNFIPYEAFNFAKGTHDYYCQVFIRDSNDCTLASSNYYSFTGTGSGERRVSYADGSYADITENDDGSITQVTYKPCTICHGSKICKLCGGAGGNWGGYGNYRRYVICNSCGGSGQCKYCMGSGTTVFTSTYYPNTGTTVGQDLWSGRTYVSGGGSDDDDDTRSSRSSNSSCSICNGTGVDSFAYEGTGGAVGSGLAVAYTNSSGSKCPYCGQYTWHQHVYCPKCRADKHP